mgnify:CR=1 FL=1
MLLSTIVCTKLLLYIQLCLSCLFKLSIKTSSSYYDVIRLSQFCLPFRTNNFTPLLLGLIAICGGARMVNHYTTPVHAFFSSATTTIAYLEIKWGKVRQGLRVKTDLKLWHKRISHINLHKLQNMKVKGVVVRLPTFTEKESTRVCEGCQFGKQH